jgi:hypothetical protein
LFDPRQEEGQESFINAMVALSGKAGMHINTGFIMNPSNAVSLIFIIEDTGL